MLGTQFRIHLTSTNVRHVNLNRFTKITHFRELCVFVYLYLCICVIDTPKYRFFFILKNSPEALRQYLNKSNQ